MQHEMIRLTVALDEPGVTQQHAADLSMIDAAADPEMVGRTLQALSARVLGALDLPMPAYIADDRTEQDPAAEDETAPTLREHAAAWHMAPCDGSCCDPAQDGHCTHAHACAHHLTTPTA